MDKRRSSLDVQTAVDRPDLLAAPVAAALAQWKGAVAADEIGVTEIDPDLADTAAFTDRYGVSLDQSANCVIVVGRREGQTRFAACVVLATTRADVNGVVRRHLDVRKASFAPMDVAVAETGMEYGGITPIGLPESWPILVDAAVAHAGGSTGGQPGTADAESLSGVVIGSGVRRSKLIIPGAALADLPGAVVIDGLGR